MAHAWSRSIAALLLIVETTSAAYAGPRVSNGPVGGTARAFAVDPANPLVIYAATADSGGVFKTTDGGATWSAVNTGLATDVSGISGPDFTAIAVDPVTPTTVYVGRAVGFPAGLYKSTNGGTTWAAANTGIAGQAVFAIAIDPTAPTGSCSSPASPGKRR